MTRRPLLAPLVALLVLAAGASSHAASSRSALDSKRASRASATLLERHGLGRVARKDPRRALQILSELRGEQATKDVVSATAIAELAILAARSKQAAWSPREKLGLYLCAVEHVKPHAVAALAAGPQEELPFVAALHNHALGRVVANLQLAPGSDEGPLDIEGPLGGYSIGWRDERKCPWSAATHYLRPAENVRVERFRRRVTTVGIGAPLVAVRKGEIPNRVRPERGWFPSYEYFYPLTAVLEGERPRAGRRAFVVRLLDPLDQERVKLDGRKLPLAADFTAQLAMLVEAVVDDGPWRDGMLRAGREPEEATLFLLEPPRRGKIPVVFVHGLQSEAATWTPMFNALRNDPQLRRRYQFWLFDYPTGLPFTYSAMQLRRSLRRVVRDTAGDRSRGALERTVLIGHSMGGLLTRLQVTDGDTALWDALFTRSIEESGLEPPDARLAREMYVLEPLPFVARAVFIATPHRGSPVADGMIGKMGSTLVRLPADLREAAARVVEANRDHMTPGARERLRLPDSIETLSPTDVVIRALGTLPIARGVPYHSILGDKGDGDGTAGSDGVVPYWSAHLEGAASETVVPSGHKAHLDPAAIEEVRRILGVHIGRGSGRTNPRREGRDP
jgi:pimeloyl-ACP methyl ester carboxylesterase